MVRDGGFTFDSGFRTGSYHSIQSVSMEEEVNAIKISVLGIFWPSWAVLVAHSVLSRGHAMLDILLGQESTSSSNNLDSLFSLASKSIEVDS